MTLIATDECPSKADRKKGNHGSVPLRRTQRSLRRLRRYRRTRCASSSSIVIDDPTLPGLSGDRLRGRDVRPVSRWPFERAEPPRNAVPGGFALYAIAGNVCSLSPAFGPGMRCPVGPSTGSARFLALRGARRPVDGSPRSFDPRDGAKGAPAAREGAKKADTASAEPSSEVSFELFRGGIGFGPTPPSDERIAL